MDRHDAKPRRPSLLADVEPQHPAATGPQPARILADMERPAARPRGGGARPGRAWLLGGAGVALLALLAVWLGGAGEGATPDNPPVETAAAAAASDATLPAEAATIVDEAGAAPDPAPADNPFEAATGATTETTSTAASAVGPTADNPFATLDAAGAAPARAVARTTPASTPTGAPRVAAARRTAAPTAVPTTGRAAKPAAATARKRTRAGEPDLLDTLMDNIQQSSATEMPARDTKGMDRLVREVNRPDAEPLGKTSGVATAATLAAGSAAVKPTAASPPPATAVAKGRTSPALSERQLRALLDQCPDARSAQSMQCRRSICKQYAPDDKRCLRR